MFNYRRLFCTAYGNSLHVGHVTTELTADNFDGMVSDGAVDFQKPISCHLYPLRIEDYGEFKAVNYHEWDICRCALAKGKDEGIPLYKYLRIPLVRRFGQQWYDELCQQCENRK